MLKRISVATISMLMLSQTGALCSTGNEDVHLDAQRNELLKQITTALVDGTVTIADAQRLKLELDNVVKLETRVQGDPASHPAHLPEIRNALAQAQKDIRTATHETKVWIGIDSSDKILQQKITDALDQGKITREQAIGLKQQADELRARESNGDPSHGFEFTDAVSLATDLQTLNKKIDEAAIVRQ